MWFETVNCHHDYTEREKHYGRELWVEVRNTLRQIVNVKGA